MRDFPNDKLQKSWCDGDPSLQIWRIFPETCQAALRDIIKNTAQFAVIRWSIDGWLPKAEPGAIAAAQPFEVSATAPAIKVEDPKVADQVLWTGVAANNLDEPAWTKRQLSGRPPYPPLCRVLGPHPMQGTNRYFRPTQVQRRARWTVKEGDTADFAKDP